MLSNAHPRRYQLRSLFTFALPAVLALGMSACGGGSSNEPGGASGTLDLLIHDAPVDELLAFEGTLERLELLGAAGSTGNLLPEETRVEFLGLDGISKWIGQAELAAGTYDRARLVFAPDSLAAKAKDGSAVAIDAATLEWVVDFVEPFTVGGDYRRLALDLDLAEALTGELSAPPLRFEPAGSAANDTSATTSIDEFRGIVVGASLPDRRLQVRAFTDDTLAMQLGIVNVGIDDETALVDDNGQMFDTSAGFFAALKLGLTVVEVHGMFLPSGDVRAEKVEIEDQAGGVGMQPRVVIEGVVLDVFGDQALGYDGIELLISEIVQGADLAHDVLEGLGSPKSIEVRFGPDTMFFVEKYKPAGPGDLAVGQHVKLEFRLFGAPPFLADEVEIRDLAVEVEGRIVDASELPESFVMLVHEYEPAFAHDGDGGEHDGDDDDDDDDDGSKGFTKELRVFLSEDTEVFLKVDGSPALDPERLVNGLHVDVRGLLQLTDALASLQADRIRVRPGRLDKAIVVGIVPDEHAFHTVGGKLKEPFGGEVGTGPLDVELDPSAFFYKDAKTEAEFYAAFEQLAADEHLEARVFGIGTEVPGLIQAFEIRAQVKHEGNGQGNGDGDD